MSSKKCNIGGQAVIEGVMMKSRKKLSVAVRLPDRKISVRKERFVSLSERFAFLGWPFIRGFVSLIETMHIGMKTLIYSANMQLEEGEKAEPLSTGHVALSVLLAITFAIVLFKVLPLAVATLIARFTTLGQNRLMFNLVDGLVRICVFVSYVYLISLMKDMRRVFEYHGAEHKVIACYEAGKELTPKNAAMFTTVHRRCGTTFMIIVLLVAIVVFSVVPINLPFFLLLLVRLPLLIPIAAVSYELLKLGAKHKKNIILRALSAPGLWLQRITTREPTREQLEIAIAAIKAVI